MANFNISIPDEYLPGIIAQMHSLNSKKDWYPPDEPNSDLTTFVANYAVQMAHDACVTYKVGPYYEGPVPPIYNPDGTPFTPQQ